MLTLNWFFLLICILIDRFWVQRCACGRTHKELFSLSVSFESITSCSWFYRKYFFLINSLPPDGAVNNESRKWRWESCMSAMSREKYSRCVPFVRKGEKIKCKYCWFSMQKNEPGSFRRKIVVNQDDRSVGCDVTWTAPNFHFATKIFLEKCLIEGKWREALKSLTSQLDQSR